MSYINYAKSYEGAARQFTDSYASVGTIDVIKTFLGGYQKVYEGAFNRSYEGVFHKQYESVFGGTFVGVYEKVYLGNYTKSYEGSFNKAYEGLFARTYTKTDNLKAHSIQTIIRITKELLKDNFQVVLMKLNTQKFGLVHMKTQVMYLLQHTQDNLKEYLKAIIIKTITSNMKALLQNNLKVALELLMKEHLMHNTQVRLQTHTIHIGRHYLSLIHI